ncbi:MAG: polysaccharide export protein [Alphaproteobacteria bacterium]|nr:polysaccharide export protein [Alphaproteobacteria bacterium]
MTSVLALILALVLGAAAGGAERPVYRLGSGDRIVVTVFGHEDLSGEFELDGEGRIALPLVGEVALGHRSLREAEGLVADRLKPDYLVNPRVSIQVANYRPFYILGEVKQPGSYPYVNGLTVVQAVAIAGGYTYRARQSRVSIQRARDPAAQQQGVGPDTVVLPGDIVNVPERYF